MEILGIDVGGSGIKGAIVDTEKGKLLSERYRIPTPAPSTPDSIAETIKEIIDFFEWKKDFGVGFPAAIHQNIVRTAANIHQSWIGVDVIELLQQKTGIRPTVLNDADAAGIAELKFGAGKKSKGVTILLTIGTGIGSVFFHNGKLIPNLELGHIYMPNGYKAEFYASDLARKRDDLKWKQWAKRFNEYLCYLEGLLWPDLFILGGGASKKFEKFEGYLETRTPVVPAALKNHAGIIGAAIAVID